MAQTITKWPTSVELDPLNDPTLEDRIVIYDSSSHEFTLVEQISSSICADSASISSTATNKDYGYSLFSQGDDGCQPLFGEVTFRQDYNSNGGYNGSPQKEFFFGGDGSTRHADSVALGDLQLRIQSASDAPTIFSGHRVASYEGIVSSGARTINSEGQISLYTIQTPHRAFKDINGSDSFDEPLSSSFNYIQIKHAASILNDTNERHQASTTTIMWARNSSNIADDVIINTVEDLRYPGEKIIYDPTSFRGEWSIEGNLQISVFHYDIDDNVRHTARFTTMGHPQPGQ